MADLENGRTLGRYFGGYEVVQARANAVVRYALRGKSPAQIDKLQRLMPTDFLEPVGDFSVDLLDFLQSGQDRYWSQTELERFVVPLNLRMGDYLYPIRPLPKLVSKRTAVTIRALSEMDAITRLRRVP